MRGGRPSSGGVIWGQHRPNYSRCRCPKCMEKRIERAALPKTPKHPRGRPPKSPFIEAHSPHS